MAESTDATSEVPLAFVDLIACGVGALTLLLFTALMPLVDGRGDSDAVGYVTFVFEGDVPPQFQVVFTQNSYRLNVRQQNGETVVESVQPQESWDTDQIGLVSVTHENADPQIQVTWDRLLRSNGSEYEWEWTAAFEYTHQLSSTEMELVFPEVSRGRPSSVSIRAFTVDGEELSPLHRDLASAPPDRPATMSVRFGSELEVGVLK